MQTGGQMFDMDYVNVISAFYGPMKRQHAEKKAKTLAGLPTLWQRLLRPI